MNESLRLIFVAALPPPIHGAALVNQFALKQIQQRIGQFSSSPETFRCFNTTPKSNYRLLQIAYRLIVYLRAAVHVARCAASKGSRPTVYVSLNGGAGTLFDLGLCIAAKLFGVRVIAHHHSYQYLNKKTWIMQRIQSLFAADDINVTLDSAMSSTLRKVYRCKARYLEVSNLAPAETALDVAKRSSSSHGVEVRAHSKVVLGFIGNITISKGFGLFLETARALDAMGIKYHLRIAGPFCDAAARDLLDRFTEDHSNCEWIGPVHASAKVLFFQTIDCLLFPSNYVNEAQPLVLLEAAASGVPWIASSIGSIPDLANQLEQKTAPAGTAFVQHAVRTIQTWALEPRSIAQAKQATAAAARRAAMESKKQWVALLDLVLERG